MLALRDLELRHLVALDAVAREGTFGRAAERLGYTQSAVSQQIQALERVVGGRVFDRPGGPRPVELTPLGIELLPVAQELIGRIDQLEVQLERFRTGEVGRITVGTFQSVSATLLPPVVGRLRAEAPDVEVRVVEADHDDMLDEALANGELDVSFMVGDRSGQFESAFVLDDPFVVVARPGQYPPGPVAVDVLGREPMIGQHANSCQIMNEAGLRSAGLDPHYVFRTNDNGTVAAMVRAGMGVAVLPLMCVEPEDPRTALHPIDPPMPERRITIVWRAGRTLAPVAARFVELAKEVGAEFADRELPAGLVPTPSP